MESFQFENSQQTAKKLVLSESDKLNGNNQGPDQSLLLNTLLLRVQVHCSSKQDGAQPV